MNSLSSEFCRALRQLADQERSFRLQITEPGLGGAVVDVDIEPCNPRSAPIWLSVDDDGITGRFGEYVIVNFFPFANSPVATVVGSVVDHCLAVVRGQYEERTWQPGGRVKPGCGIFTFPDDHTTTTRTNKVFRFFSRAEGKALSRVYEMRERRCVSLGQARSPTTWNRMTTPAG